MYFFYFKNEKNINIYIYIYMKFSPRSLDHYTGRDVCRVRGRGTNDHIIEGTKIGELLYIK